MTRTQIIKTAHQHTENKLVGVIDDQLEFAHAHQQFCAEHRFWWRKKSLTFSTAGNTPTYDLNSITTTPSGAGPFVEEITKIVRIEGTNVTPLNAITDDEAVSALMCSTASDKPGVWTMDSADLGKNQTLRFNIPNGIYTIQVFFWAMPSPAVDSSDETVYVVPSALHHALVTSLEKIFMRVAYGVQDPKYLTTAAEYKAKVDAAKMRPSFWSGKAQVFADQSNSAIRSTR